MNDEFAAFLRGQRRRRKLSQAVLARNAQISERALRNWETGGSSPSRGELQNILTTLDLTPQERVQALALLPTPRARTLTRQELHRSPLLNEDLGPLPVLGDLLQAMRRRNGWTQDQMAATLQITRTTILRWEAGDTLPSAENLQRICVLLKASPEEQAALSDRRLQVGASKSALSLEECGEQVTALDGQTVGLTSALIDLRALALKRRLWVLAGESKEASRLLGHVQVIHANWLNMYDRKKEAEGCVQRALNLLEGHFASDPYLPGAVNLAAHLAGAGKGGNAASVALLKGWAPVFPKQIQITLWCDSALYAGLAQQHEAAQSYLSNALQVLPYCSDPEGMSRYYYPLTRARILMSAGRSGEALQWLPSAPETEPITQHIFYQTLWAEALLAAGEYNDARRYVDRLGASLTQHPQPRYQRKLEMLSARL